MAKVCFTQQQLLINHMVLNNKQTYFICPKLLPLHSIFVFAPNDKGMTCFVWLILSRLLQNKFLLGKKCDVLSNE